MHFSFLFRKSIMIEFFENLVYWIICQLFGCSKANLGPLTRRHPQPPDIHQSLYSAWFGPYLTSNLAMKLNLNVRPIAAVEILSEENIPLYQTPMWWMLVCKIPNDNVSLDSIWPGITRPGLYNPKMSGPCIV